MATEEQSIIAILSAELLDGAKTIAAMQAVVDAACTFVDPAPGTGSTQALYEAVDVYRATKGHG
jgi:hypothetical protein